MDPDAAAASNASYDTGGTAAARAAATDGGGSSAQACAAERSGADAKWSGGGSPMSGGLRPGCDSDDTGAVACRDARGGDRSNSKLTGAVAPSRTVGVSLRVTEGSC